MILSILKSYLTLLLSVSAGSLLLLILGLYVILRKPREKSRVVTMSSDTTDDLRHLAAIAGDDLVTTQLDLARAYIETSKKPAAASILQCVMKQGSAEQKLEAQQLLKSL